MSMNRCRVAQEEFILLLESLLDPYEVLWLHSLPLCS